MANYITVVAIIFNQKGYIYMSITYIYNWRFLNNFMEFASSLPFLYNFETAFPILFSSRKLRKN